MQVKIMEWIRGEKALKVVAGIQEMPLGNFWETAGRF
jgi:hypothetical protein